MSLGKPIISNRLPKAFSQPRYLTNKKLQDHQDLTAMNEFKNVKKLLSPIKQISPDSSDLRKVINKLACFPKLANPSHTLTLDFLMQSVVKLEEMITLSIIKSSSLRSGIVRKSLHAPSLKIYACKEFPVGTMNIRQKLLESLKIWENLQRGSRALVEVNGSFWNCPEGCVTIIMEYMPGESLLRLCESIGAIPEKVLKVIGNRVLSGLGHFHKKVGAYGGLDLSHILLNKEGKAKLGLALSSRLLAKDEEKKVNLEDDVFDFGASLLSASVGGPDWSSKYSSLKGECCLFHSAIILSEIPYLSRFSKSFSSFLCLSTKYNKDTRGKVPALLAHDWFKSKDSAGPDVTIKELIDLSVIGSKDLTFDKQTNALCENLKVVLTECSEFKSFNKANIRNLAFELGTTTEALSEKLSAVYI